MTLLYDTPQQQALQLHQHSHQYVLFFYTKVVNLKLIKEA